MSFETQQVVKGYESDGYTHEDISEFLSVTGVSYSVSIIRRWAADPEAVRHLEPDFPKMLYISQFHEGKAADFARSM